MQVWLFILLVASLSLQAVAEENPVSTNAAAVTATVGGAALLTSASNRIRASQTDTEIFQILYHNRGIDLINDPNLATAYDNYRGLRFGTYTNAMEQQTRIAQALQGQDRIAQQAADQGQIKSPALASKFKDLKRFKKRSAGSGLSALASILATTYFLSSSKLDENTNPVVEVIALETNNKATQ
jgi:hypothetical protein